MCSGLYLELLLETVLAKCNTHLFRMVWGRKWGGLAGGGWAAPNSGPPGCQVPWARPTPELSPLQLQLLLPPPGTTTLPGEMFPFMKLVFLPESSTHWSVLQEVRGGLLPAESLLPQGYPLLPPHHLALKAGVLWGPFTPVTLLHPVAFSSPVSLVVHPEVAPGLLPCRRSSSGA